MNKPNISEIILDYIDQNRISKSAIARELGIKRNNFGMRLRNENMTVDFVLKISNILDNDFFNELSNIHFGKPDEKERIEKLESEIEILNLEKKLLMEIIDKRMERPS